LSNKLSTYTEQATAGPLPEQNEPPIIFLGIGVVINVLMITAYFIWAYKQWKKTDKPDK